MAGNVYSHISLPMFSVANLLVELIVCDILYFVSLINKNIPVKQLF